MKRLLTVMAILALAGCASVPPPVANPVPPPTVHEKVEAPEVKVVAPRSTATESPRPQSHVPRVTTEPAPEPETPKLTDDLPVAAPGEKVVLIESSPSGATVVIDGVPVGKTPFSITVAGTSRGFFRGQTMVRVRFIATDARETSVTVDEVFAPTDRIPSRVVFSPEGARRIW